MFIHLFKNQWLHSLMFFVVCSYLCQTLRHCSKEIIDRFKSNQSVSTEMYRIKMKKNNKNQYPFQKILILKDSCLIILLVALLWEENHRKFNTFFEYPESFIYIVTDIFLLRIDVVLSISLSFSLKVYVLTVSTSIYSLHAWN